MQGMGQVFYLPIGDMETPERQKAQHFSDRLASDVGLRTTEQFTVDGEQVFDTVEPFDPPPPPTIILLIPTDTELEDILIFVATVEPVDLGVPMIEHQ